MLEQILKNLNSAPQQPQGLAQQILSSRFEQPSFGDVANSTFQGALNDKYIDPQSIVDSRNNDWMKKLAEVERLNQENQRVGLQQSQFDESVRHNRETERRLGMVANRRTGGATGQSGMPLSPADQRMLNGQVEKYSKAIESTGLSELVGNAELANNAIRDENGNLRDDVSGFGYVAGALPDWMVSQEGKDTRQSIAGLRNAILKARSGGAVTPTEAERFLQELGEGGGKTDEQIKQGIFNITKTLHEKITNAQAGYDPRSLDIYKQRGGTVTSSRLDPYLSNAKSVSPAPQGVDPGDWEFMTPEERALFGG